MMKYLTKEVKVALVVTAGIVVLFFGLNFLKGAAMFSGNETYYIEFKNVSGLSVSSPIYADGFKVGVVSDIQFDYDHKSATKVVVELNKDLRIPKGSSAEIVSDMLGNVQINLLLANNPRERILPGETIQGTINSGMMAKAANLIPAVEQMMPKLDSILTSLNNLLADPSIAQSLHNIQTITQDLTVTTREVNTLMGGLNRKMPGILAKADETLDHTNLLTGNLASLDVQSTFDQVNQTLANVQELTDKLNDQKGTLGLLINDPGLYHHVDATVRNADSLVLDLKTHPKRYVHFSVFGKKDK